MAELGMIRTQLVQFPLNMPRMPSCLAMCASPCKQHMQAQAQLQAMHGKSFNRLQPKSNSKQHLGNARRQQKWAPHVAYAIWWRAWPNAR
jgi:hypothetical protein